MPFSRRHLLLTATAVTWLSACSDRGTTSGTPTPSTSSSTPASPSPGASTPIPLLTEEGQAREVVRQLRTAASNAPVIKVDITETQATMSVLVDKRPQTYAWDEGRIDQVSSDIEYIQQATFEPEDFAFDNLKLIFGQAGALSGSTSNQELQIVEYTPGQVLMTVSTRPESRPVFFRADGTPIHELDYRSKVGITEGLSDAVGGRTQLYAVGYTKDAGLWVDAPDAAKPGMMVRRTRSAKLPTWLSERKQDPDRPLFAPSDISPEVLARLMVDLPRIHDKDVDADIRYEIDMRDGRNLPTMHFWIGGKHVVTDMQGTDITAEIEG